MRKPRSTLSFVEFCDRFVTSCQTQFRSCTSFCYAWFSRFSSVMELGAGTQQTDRQRVQSVNRDKVWRGSGRHSDLEDRTDTIHQSTHRPRHISPSAVCPSVSLHRKHMQLSRSVRQARIWYHWTFIICTTVRTGPGITNTLAPQQNSSIGVRSIEGE